MKQEFLYKIDERNTKRWYLNGDLHREDGPAVEYSDGDKYWYLNDSLHREDGPAIEWSNGTKKWYINNKLHREDGPAIEYSDGFNAWFYNDKKIHCKDNQEFLRMIKLMAFL